MRYVAKLTTFLKFQNMQFSQLPSPFFTSSEKRKKIAERKNPIKDLDHVVFAMIVLFSLQSHKKKDFEPRMLPQERNWFKNKGILMLKLKHVLTLWHLLS